MASAVMPPVEAAAYEPDDASKDKSSQPRKRAKLSVLDEVTQLLQEVRPTLRATQAIARA